MTPAPADLQAEATWLATRSSAEREQYLNEVAHCLHRGPEVAEQLHERVFELLQGRAGAPA